MLHRIKPKHHPLQMKTWSLKGHPSDVNDQQRQGNHNKVVPHEHYHNKSVSHHIRNNALRASSTALRPTDDDRTTVTVPVDVADVPFATTALPAAALALFAAAAARKRLAPLGRFTRPIVPLPLPVRGIFSISISVPIPIPIALPITPPRSRSTRRKNGLGRFSSSCRSYIGGGGRCCEEVGSLEETARVPPDEDEDDDDGADDEVDDDDDDDDDEEEEPAFVMVVVGSSVFAVSASGASSRLVWDREDMDGRRRRLAR